MAENLKIKVILGSTRPGRFGDKPANWIAELAKQKTGVDVELLDLRDHELPMFNEPKSPLVMGGVYPNALVTAWAAKIAEADAFIMVTPEYNHGYSAVLKNAIDHLYPEWANKPVAFVSWGVNGGVRAVEQLRQVIVQLSMASVQTGITIASPWLLVDEKGDLKPGALDDHAKSAEKMLDQLISWGNALKVVRNVS